MGVSLNSGFSPQIIHFKRVFHYKPSILGYPYFWKHPYMEPSSCCVWVDVNLRPSFRVYFQLPAVRLLGGYGYSTIFSNVFLFLHTMEESEELPEPSRVFVVASSYRILFQTTADNRSFTNHNQNTRKKHIFKKKLAGSWFRKFKQTPTYWLNNKKIPRTTTVWMYKTLLKSLDFNYQPQQVSLPDMPLASMSYP